MPKPCILILLLICLYPALSYGNTDSLPAKYLSLGSRKAGICFGNSPEYTGFRFNAVNKHVRRVNIFDFTLWNAGDDTVQTSNGIAISATIISQYKSNGITIAPLVNAAARVNGLTLSGIASASGRMNGVALGGMINYIDTINGVLVGVGAISFTNNTRPTSVANGLVVGPSFIRMGRVNGITLAAINESDAHTGLALGVYNKSRKLRGVQIGLFNIVENNPRGLQRLPFINMHLGK
ncbi:LA_2272 family surface repeat-containing protein [Chitinophaga rhizophila]|uniref:Uncharacterized protein n=1 Tax=Chitinophaga rhizophila TaxID=2866212 RepID=A0ABS7GAW1_9BACT|nr:hypothetical protein [Chitinophaga rhizophila]MBW8684802.1 hypothetical protein [Chitinophaga rhizophila]